MAAVAYNELERMQEEELQQDGAKYYAPKDGAKLASSKLEQGGRKWAEKILVGAARAAWPVFQFINTVHQGKPFQPKWAPAPLLKKKERSFPQLGWPRTTDSLCPRCVKEAREAII